MNLQYEEHRQKFLANYFCCYNKDGSSKLTTISQRRELLECTQNFAKSLGLADNRTYFGNYSNGYLNDEEIRKVYRKVCYDV